VVLRLLVSRVDRVGLAGSRVVVVLLASHHKASQAVDHRVSNLHQASNLQVVVASQAALQDSVDERGMLKRRGNEVEAL